MFYRHCAQEIVSLHVSRLMYVPTPRFSRLIYVPTPRSISITMETVMIVNSLIIYLCKKIIIDGSRKKTDFPIRDVVM